MESKLSVGASATVEVLGFPVTFSDSDEQSLGGTIDAAFDLNSADEFPIRLGFELTGAEVVHLAPFALDLGGGVVDVVVNDAVVDVTTPSPPATLTRLLDPGVLYEFDAAEFEIAIVEGIAAATGFGIDDSIDFSETPAVGSPDPETHFGEISFVATPLGDGGHVDAVLRLPISFVEETNFEGVPVTLNVNGLVVAHSSFQIGMPEESADFDGSGVVDMADLALWEQQFGDAMSGDHFLLWQRQYEGASAVGAVPEPAAAWLIALAWAAGGGLGVRRRFPFAR